MNKNIAGVIAAVLGVVGLILILAGPAFHLLPSNLSIFAALVCWIVAGAIKSFVKKKKKEEKK
ncbi:hypothetical protein HQ584_02460 [Patescibacteria group bacterium]|nr:hypothetical protein [Patescibacteria group bacterium]